MLDLASGFCFYTFRKLVEVGGNGITMCPNLSIWTEQNCLQANKEVLQSSTLEDYFGTLLRT